MEITPPVRYSDDELLELIQREVRAVRYWLYQYLRDTQDQDDVIQNTLIAAWINSKHSAPNAPIPAWLKRIAWWQLQDWIQNEKRKGKLNPLRVEFNEELHSPEVATKEFSEIINSDLAKLLSILPEDTQQLIIKIHITGDNYPSIAKEQGCTESSLKMRVKRGMDKMRELARKEGMC